MPEPEIARRTVESYLDAWTTNDRERMLSLFRDDAVMIDPVGSSPRRGIAKIAELWDQVHSAPITYHPTLRRIVVCGAEVLVHFEMISRSDAENGVRVEIYDVMELDPEGRIVRLRAYWDEGCMTSIGG